MPNYQIRKSSGDLVAIQISVRVNKNAAKQVKFSRALIESMIRHKADTSRGEWSHSLQTVVGAIEGEDPIGVKLSIIRWKNPDRLADEDQGWRYADPDSPEEQAQAWGSLRRVVRDAALSVRLNR